MYELGIAPFSEHQIERALLRYRTRIDALFRDGDISNTNDMSLASELSLFSKLLVITVERGALPIVTPGRSMPHAS